MNSKLLVLLVLVAAAAAYPEQQYGGEPKAEPEPEPAAEPEPEPEAEPEPEPEPEPQAEPEPEPEPEPEVSDNQVRVQGRSSVGSVGASEQSVGDSPQYSEGTDSRYTDPPTNETECVAGGGECIPRGQCPNAEYGWNQPFLGICDQQGFECCFKDISQHRLKCGLFGGDCTRPESCGRAPQHRNALCDRPGDVCCIWLF